MCNHKVKNLYAIETWLLVDTYISGLGKII
jgi:hypothetical protein